MRFFFILLTFLGVISCGGSMGSNGSSGTPSVSDPDEPEDPVEPDPLSSVFIYRADSAANKIYLASIDTATGELAEHGATAVGPCGPVSLAVSSDKKYLFVACTDTDTIDTYGIDQATGELTKLISNSTATPIGPVLKIAADPLNRFLWSLEGTLAGGQIVNYHLDTTDGSLAWMTNDGLGDTGRDLIVSDDGENLFVVRNSGGLSAYAVNPGNGHPNDGGITAQGSSANALLVNSTKTLLLGSPDLFGDKLESFFFDDSTLVLTFDNFLDGDQLTPFVDIALGGASENILFLLSPAPVLIRSFALTLAPTSLSTIDEVALPSGCAPQVMAHLKTEGYLVTGCTDGSGKTVSVKIEVDGSLTLKDTTVQTGLKVDDILSLSL